MAFEWDDDKAESNFDKHGITFEYAIRVFEAAVQVEWIDDREDYGEERWIVVGLVDDIELQVTYTLRGEVVRIISARKAGRYERERYWHDAI